MKDPEVAREKLQGFDQVLNDYCLFPEIRVAGWNDNFQLTSPASAGFSLHNTICERDRPSNKDEIVNTRLEWPHTIAAKPFRLDDQISLNGAAYFRSP
jgi:hypothetical protein